MIIHNQAFSKIWILVIVAVFVAGGIFAWQYFGVLKEEVKDETADWQTYKNEEHGFDIKYPTDWQLDLRGAPSVVHFDVRGDNFLTEEKLKERIGEHAYYDWRFTDDIKINVYASLNELPGNENNLSLEEWIKERMKNYLFLKNSKKEIIINKYKGIEVEEIGITSYRSIFLIHDSFIYNFFLETPHSEMNIFNQMLSTFRFLE